MKTFLFVFLVSAFAQAEDLNELFLDKDQVDFSMTLNQRARGVDSYFSDSDSQFVCIGEKHETHFRNFLAETAFSHLKADVLILEDTQENVTELLKSYHSGASNVLLIGKDFKQILDSVYALNPHVQIFGVEPNQKQKKIILDEELKSQRKRITRESFIAQNIYNIYLKNEQAKFVMLYGASHCSYNDIALGNKTSAFRHVLKFLPKSKSVRLIDLNDSNSISLFMPSDFIESIDSSIALADINEIDELEYKTVWKLKKYFSNYNDLIFFKGDNKGLTYPDIFLLDNE